MKKFLFLDLDDTIFQTLHKCSTESGLIPAAYLKDDTPISYSTPAQQAVLSCFMNEMTVIPTTARSLDAYRRVDLPFGKHAILNFGGVLLDENGQPDALWLEEICIQLSPLQTRLKYLQNTLMQFSDAARLDLRIRIIGDLGINFYLVAKHPQGNIAQLKCLLTKCIEPIFAEFSTDFKVHFNDNNLAIIPAFLNKVIGVKRLIQQFKVNHEEIITFAMGDSKSDADFMAACDYAIIPRPSQLHEFCFGNRHV